MFNLKVKLDKIKPEISRIIYIPEHIKFSDLYYILRESFNLPTYIHLSIFKIPGLNTPIWDFEITFPSERAEDMNEIYVKDYFGLIKKIKWAYDLNKTYTFTVNVQKANKKFDCDYPFIESYKREYNPIEGCNIHDFEEMLYYTLNNEEMPDYLPYLDMEKFDFDEVNKTLKKY